MYRPQFTLKTTLPRLQKEKGYQPTTDDIKSVLEAVKGTEYSIPFQLGVLGMRRGEICALTLDDLKGCDLTINKTLVYNKGWILKHTAKTDESNRVICIPDKLSKEITNNGVIFDGDPKRLNNHLHRVQKSLNIPPFRFHDLRHYFASYASTLGMPEADIMAMGGWKSDHVFKSIYRDSMQESMKQTMKRIGESIL
jgi:integrase